MESFHKKLLKMWHNVFCFVWSWRVSYFVEVGQYSLSCYLLLDKRCNVWFYHSILQKKHFKVELRKNFQFTLHFLIGFYNLLNKYSKLFSASVQNSSINIYKLTWFHNTLSISTLSVNYFSILSSNWIISLTSIKKSIRTFLLTFMLM